MQSAADHYLAERVMTASPAELTAMLYDALCANIRGAITRLEAGAPSTRRPSSSKAQDIVLELRTTLNQAAGAARRPARRAVHLGLAPAARRQRPAQGRRPARPSTSSTDCARPGARRACLAA